MLEVRGIPDINIVEIALDGRISREDFDRAVDIINAKIDE